MSPGPSVGDEVAAAGPKPPVKTVVHFVRHGEVFNPEGVLYGRLPGFRLSDRGLQMAQQATEFFIGHQVLSVVSSPLQRAQETAAPIAELFGLTVTVDDRLIEAANSFQGKPVSGRDGVLRKPASWPLYRNPFRPSWGEPYRQIALRMFAAALTARDRAAGAEAVCVSHQLPVVCLRRYVQAQRLWHDPRSRQCSLASVTSLIFSDEHVVGVHYAEPAGQTSNSLPRAPG